jgi:predicted glutamine amidotransferase
MCGLVGFVANEGRTSDINALTMLMLSNMKRGEHASGMYFGTEVIKDSDIVDIFLSKNQIESSSLFIGHVRQATIGLKIKKNAHPFEHDNLVGAHNGTLTGWYALANKMKIPTTTIDVDSDFLIKALDVNHFAEENKYDVLEQFEGAAALLWAGKTDLHTLYVFRNEDRPLFYGTREEGMYFSSTEESLKIINATNITSLPINKVFTITNGEFVGEGITIKRPAKYVNSFQRGTGSYTGGSRSAAYDDIYDNDYNNEFNRYPSGNQISLPLHNSTTLTNKYGIIVNYSYPQQLFKVFKIESTTVSGSNKIYQCTFKEYDGVSKVWFEDSEFTIVSPIVKNGDFVAVKAGIFLKGVGENSETKILENGSLLYLQEIFANALNPEETFATCYSYALKKVVDIPTEYLLSIPKDIAGTICHLQHYVVENTKEDDTAAGKDCAVGECAVEQSDELLAKINQCEILKADLVFTVEMLTSLYQAMEESSVDCTFVDTDGIPLAYLDLMTTIEDITLTLDEIDVIPNE